MDGMGTGDGCDQQGKDGLIWSCWLRPQQLHRTEFVTTASQRIIDDLLITTFIPAASPRLTSTTNAGPIAAASSQMYMAITSS